MTPPSQPNGTPRHLHDETAQMPAVRIPPRHARPDTAELRAQRPPVPPPTRHTPKRKWWQFWK